MGWVLDKDYSYSSNPTVALGGTIGDGLASDDNTTWYVASSVLRRNKSVSTSAAGLRSLGTAFATARVRRRIVITTAVIGTITQPGPQSQGYYLGAVVAATGADTGYGLAMAPGGIHAWNGSSYTGGQGGGIAAGSAYIFDVQENSIPGGGGLDVTGTVYTTGAPTTPVSTFTYTGLSGLSNAIPAISLQIDPADAGAVGITRVQIYHWDASALPLALVSATGNLSLSGTTVTITAPTVSGGVGVVHWAWKAYPTLDATSSTLTIASGTGTPTDLSWSVPSGWQGVFGGIAMTVNDDNTTIAGIGYDSIPTIGNARYPVEGANGIYCPFYVPGATVPDAAALTAIYDPTTLPAGKKIVIGRVGDSITAYDLSGSVELMQTYLDANWSGKFVVVNGGHASATLADWATTAAATGTGASVIPGQTSNNNYTGLVNAVTAANTGAWPVVVSSFLGTNVSSATSSDYSTLLGALQTAFGATTLTVQHEVIFQPGFYNSNNVTFAAYNTSLIEPTVNTGLKRYQGAKPREYFVNHLGTDFGAEDIHPNTVGRPHLDSLQLQAIFTALNAEFPATAPTTKPTITFAYGASGIVVSPSTSSGLTVHLLKNGSEVATGAYTDTTVVDGTHAVPTYTAYYSNAAGNGPTSSAISPFKPSGGTTFSPYVKP